MSEVAITFDARSGIGDWTLLAGGDLAQAPAMHTAVLVSLVTDARAHADDVLDLGETDRRGWWADGVTGRPIGSRLWLLRRAKATRETLARARDMMREALQWLVDDGLAASVLVTAEWQGASRLAARISVTRHDGSVDTITADWAWQGIA